MSEVVREGGKGGREGGKGGREGGTISMNGATKPIKHYVVGG